MALVVVTRRPSGFSLVRKGKECSSERECKFMEVKAVVRSYDWGVPIMVIEQCVAAVVWNHIRVGCLLRSRKEFRGCRAKEARKGCKDGALDSQFGVNKKLCT